MTKRAGPVLDERHQDRDAGGVIRPAQPFRRDQLRRRRIHPYGKASGAARGGSRRRQTKDIEPQFTAAVCDLVGPLPGIGKLEGLSFPGTTTTGVTGDELAFHDDRFPSSNRETERDRPASPESRSLGPTPTPRVIHPLRGHSRGRFRTNEGHTPPYSRLHSCPPFVIVHESRWQPCGSLACSRTGGPRLGAESGAGSDPLFSC